MFRFGSREAFLYLWVIPIVFFISWAIVRATNKKIEAQLGKRLTPFLLSSISMPKRRLKLVLEVLTLILFVIAMARPQMGSSLQEVKSEGVEMMLLVDVSKSMMAEDNKPNRLETVKIELKKLLDRLSGDKVGIVVFAGNAFLISPLTTDYSAIKLFLDSLSTDSVSTQGTEIKPALDAAVEAFRRGGVDPDEGVAVTRVILIASDGEDHEKGAIQAAKKYFNEGVRIFSLGVGTEQGAPIPIRDETGYLKGYLRDSGGQVVNSQHHGQFLTELAAAGGGGYYHLGNPNAIDQVQAQLSRLQKSQFETGLATEYDERFQIFLLFGILFGFLELVLGERKTGQVIWRGRVGAMQTGIVIFMLASVAHAFPMPDTIKRNNSVVDVLKEKQAYQAHKELTDILSNAPFQPEVRLNLAYAFEINEEFDKAIGEYLAVANGDADDRLKFEAYFNAARLLTEQKKINDALEKYQKALEINPTSVEVKTNIELLFQSKNGGGNNDDKDKDKDKKDKQDKKDKDKEGKDQKGEGDQQKDKSEGQKPKENPKRAPQPFKSEELSDHDVKNILEELKRQEEKNRAKVMEQPAKENPNGPEW